MTYEITFDILLSINILENRSVELFAGLNGSSFIIKPWSKQGFAADKQDYLCDTLNLFFFLSVYICIQNVSTKKMHLTIYSHHF